MSGPGSVSARITKALRRSMRSRIRGRTWLATTLVAAAAGIALLAAGEDRAGRYTPPDTAPRLAAAGIELPPVARVSDIAAHGNILYVLDGVAGSVLRVDAGSGRVDLRFGRRGGGPGEFVQARSIAVSPDGDSVVVADGEALHFFSGDGGFGRLLRPRYPCPVNDPQVSWATYGVHVAASCVRTGSDTLFAVLWRVNDAGGVTEIVREGRFTFDGAWGSIYGPRFFATETTEALAFGTATSTCVRLVRPHGVTPWCPPHEASYRAAPPTERARAVPRSGLLRWPDPLPHYVDRFVAGHALWLVRPFRHDSIVVRRIAPSGERVDTLVAPLDDFVRCRGSACYWVEAAGPAASRLRIMRVGGG